MKGTGRGWDSAEARAAAREDLLRRADRVMDPEEAADLRDQAADLGPCQCGDSYCEDTFGKATAGQDRSGCCQYCGWFDCDVCGWSATVPGQVTS
ncbi:hypothetical protein GCM10025331_64530 [Actinoplanes utahensis]|nr:hypothetical protein Aut01nite_42070 [Actinoplanes utahensis]